MSLLRALSFRPVSNGDPGEDDEAATGDKRKASGSDDVDPGKDIMEDLVRAFRNWVDGREWLHMRLTVS